MTIWTVLMIVPLLAVYGWLYGRFARQTAARLQAGFLSQDTQMDTSQE